MAEQEWMQFTRTGSVSDYLAYSMANYQNSSGTDHGAKEKEREQRDGTDHCAYRNGDSGHPYRGV